ncbi:MAG: hypothetical protein RID93_03940 [Sandaracinaceae bacterium]
MTNAPSASEEVGRLLFELESVDGEPTYRSEHGRRLAVSRGVEEVVGERRYPGSIAVLIGVLGAILLLFAIRVGSGPAIGSVSVVLMALAWLVFRARRPRRTGRETLTVEDDVMRLAAPSRSAEVALADVLEIGTGVDGPLRTVWARTSDDRVLLFVALTDVGADAMQDALREALARVAPQP